MNSRFFSILSACGLVACGAAGQEHYGPAPDEALPVAELGDGWRPPAAATPDTVAADLSASGEGLLEISTRGSVTSFLGATHCVVSDADGQVVAGADEETTSPETAPESQLSFRLAADADYSLSLTATTQDTRPTTCRAAVGPVRVEPGATARVRVLAWDCGDVVGHVASTAQDDCYWLADWTFVSRTALAVGDAVDVGVALPPALADQAVYRWSSAAPELGGFADPAAARTTLRCQAAGEELPFQVAVSDGTCEQRITHAVTCR